jgi:hypothetical protein
MAIGTGDTPALESYCIIIVDIRMIEYHLFDQSFADEGNSEIGIHRRSMNHSGVISPASSRKWEANQMRSMSMHRPAS